MKATPLKCSNPESSVVGFPERERGLERFSPPANRHFGAPALSKVVTLHPRFERTPLELVVKLPLGTVPLALAVLPPDRMCPLEIGFNTQWKGTQGKRHVPTSDMVLLYCCDGKGWCDCGDQRRDLRAGDLVLVPPGLAYSFGGDPTATSGLFWLRSTGRDLQKALERLDLATNATAVGVGVNGQPRSAFEQLLDLLGNARTVPQFVRAADLLSQILSVFANSSRDTHQGEFDIGRRIEQSISYMRQHLDQPMRAATLAARANISLPHYFALFKRLTGHTPIDYFIHLRMDRASELLNSTVLSVKEIAASLGYEDQFYFSRMFKAVHSVSPSEFRLKRTGCPDSNHPSQQASPRRLRTAERTTNSLRMHDKH